MEPFQLDSGELAHEPEEASAGNLLLPLLRWRWQILSCILLGAAVGIGLGVVQPNSYLSTAKLLVRHGAREEATPETVIAGPGGQGFGRPMELVTNEIQLLAVPQVFERAARDVTPQRIFSTYDPSAADGEETSFHVRLLHRLQAWWFRIDGNEVRSRTGHAVDDCAACLSEATHALMKHVVLAAEPMSSVITVSYAAHDPDLAHQVVGAFLNAAENHHRETYSTDTTLAFVSQRLQESLAEVQATETEFNEYRLACEVFDYDSQRSELMELHQDLERQAAEDAAKLSQLRSSSAALMALLTESRRAILQERLFELQHSLQALGEKAGGTTAERAAERAPIERRIERTTAQLKEQSVYMEETSTELSAVNSRHQRLTQELDDLKQQLAAQESATSGVADRLRSVRLRLIAIEQCEPRYRFLQATARNAQSSYDAFVKTYERTNLMNLLDQLEFSNLRRIQEPILPFEKAGPKRSKLLLIGILLGGLAGAALAFSRQGLDPFVRSPADVERMFRIRVVGVVPHHRFLQRLRNVIRRAA